MQQKFKNNNMLGNMNKLEFANRKKSLKLNIFFKLTAFECLFYLLFNDVNIETMPHLEA